MTFGENLKKSRLNVGLSLADVSKQIKKSVSTISLYENDLTQPSLDVLTQLCNIYHVTPNDLLDYKQDACFEDMDKKLNRFLLEYLRLRIDIDAWDEKSDTATVSVYDVNNDDRLYLGVLSIHDLYTPAITMYNNCLEQGCHMWRKYYINALKSLTYDKYERINNEQRDKNIAGACGYNEYHITPTVTIRMTKK